MLVLSRKRSEVVVIDNMIEVEVVEIRGDRVRLGFRAPVDIPVHRREVWAAMKESGNGDAYLRADGASPVAGPHPGMVERLGSVREPSRPSPESP